MRGLSVGSQGDRRLTIHSRSYLIAIGNKKSASAGRYDFFQRLLRLYDGIGLKCTTFSGMKCAENLEIFRISFGREEEKWYLCGGKWLR